MGIILLAVPIFILSIGTLFYQSRNLIHEEVLSSNTNMLDKGLYQVRSYMSTIETAVNSNVWMMEEYLTPDSLESVSGRIVRLNDPVVSCSVFMVPDYFKEYAKTAIPMERYGVEGELDAAAVFLASPASSYVSGIALPVDGGYTSM